MDWLNSLKGPTTWADLITIVVGIIAIGGSVIAIIPRSRTWASRAFRYVGRWVSRIPWRIVRVQPPDPQAQSPVDSVPNLPTSSVDKRPLSLRERSEKLAAALNNALAEHDARRPKDRLIGEFRWVRGALDPLNAELRRLGSNDGDLDLARYGDNDRADIERARDALLRVEWKAIDSRQPLRRVLYLGPGDSVDLGGGIIVKKGEPIDLTPADVRRLRASDSIAQVADIRYRYAGEAGREFYMGVPARDLTDEDYSALAPDLRKLVDNGKMYTRLEW
jgi:hypothetical protein